MKKQFFFACAVFFSAAIYAQNIRVVSNECLGKGYYPRLSADASTMDYLAAEDESYKEEPKPDTYVTNEDLKLVLYRNGERKELYPHGTECNYIWSSVSPDGTKIVFNTKHGTGICDLNGKELVNLGKVDAPVWYGNDYIVGMYDTSDGHQYTGSAIVIRSTDGATEQVLTDPKEMGMYPSVSEKTGRIAYNTLDGNLHLLQTTLTTEPIRRAIPELRKAAGIKKQARKPKMVNGKFSDYKIYINPGHGGHDSDDRNITVYPFKSGDPEGFWESNSNLDKGLKLRDWLKGLGFQTMMSRTTNTTADDRALSAIVAEANTYNSDFMLSIHSNAGGPSNYVLQLYAGKDPDDTHTYPTATPCSEEGRIITTIIGNNLQKNAITNWSSATPRITGDKTFARTAMHWTNGYGVLRGLKVPGVISEGCMHDYIPETYRLMNMDYKYQEAWYFMRTFCEYFMSYELSKGVIGGQVRDWYNKMEFPKITARQGTRDELLPLDKATVTLLQGGKVISTYKTDTLYNGVFFFWDLEPGTYTLRAETAGYYPMEKEVTVSANNITYQDLLMNKQRSTRPKVTDYSPKVEIEDSINVATDIVLHFNWDMVDTSVIKAFSITPETEGTLSFENSYRTLRFSPARQLQEGTEYTVRLAKSACHPDTNFPNTMEEDFEFKFRTTNRSQIGFVMSYPQAGTEDVPLNPSFILLFDEPLNINTAKKAVKVVDSEGNEQNVHGRSYNFSKPEIAPKGYMSFYLVNALQDGKDYKLVIGPDMEDDLGVHFNRTMEIPFRTKATAEAEIPLANQMETPMFAYTPDESTGVKTAAVLKNTTSKLFGKASNELRYSFTEKAATVMYKYNSDELINANGNCKFGAYILSDFSGNKLYAKWDASGDIRYTLLGAMDYAGWKYLEADFSELPRDVDYQFMGLYLQREEDVLSASGSIYVDNMCFERIATGIENTEQGDVRIYPNPASEYVRAENAGQVENMRLYSTAGTLVRTVDNPVMNLADIPEGNYILRVETEKSTLHYSLLIRHN